MLLIWGTKGRIKVILVGEFYCPDCQSYHNYNHIEVKRWFTFFFIPIFPFSTTGDYVECQNCKSTFNTRVLEFDPQKELEKFEAEFSIAAKRVMFKLALADGAIDQAEIDQIVASFSEIAKREIEREDIEAELEAAKSDARSVSEYLRAAIAVAKADGNIDPEEVKDLHELSTAMEMPKAYANGVFSEEKIPTI